MHQVVYILLRGNSPEQKWIFPSFDILHRFQDTAQKTRDELVKLGFPEFTIDDFHENVSWYTMAAIAYNLYNSLNDYVQGTTTIVQLMNARSHKNC